MYEKSCRRVYCKCRRIGYRVVCSYEFYSECTKINVLSILHNLPSSVVHQVVLFQFVLYQAHRKLRRIDRHIKLFFNVRNSSYVILMSMGNYKSSDFVRVFLKICHIRNHQIYTKHIILRECQSAVNDYDRVLVLYRSDIHSNLFQTAQRNDLH